MDPDGAQFVAAEPITSEDGERLAAAARAERQRLARDLHDSVSQTLISLHLSAQAAADLWDAQPAQAREALEFVRHLTTGAITEMRAVLADLRDAVLERQGLVAALEAHGAVVRQRSGLQVELRLGEAHPGAGPAAPLPAAYEVALYRLVQEALANVVKHARATRATVTLERDTTVRLVVEDDGIGFGAPTAAFSYGLAGMRERVAALGGRLSLENRTGGGARVVADLPVPAATANVSVTVGAQERWDAMPGPYPPRPMGRPRGAYRASSHLPQSPSPLSRVGGLDQSSKLPPRRPSAFARLLINLVTNQPGDRFWPFLGLETAIFLGLAATLLALTAWWVRERVARPRESRSGQSVGRIAPQRGAWGRPGGCRSTGRRVE
jgi:hypothetical protein